jgi:LPXTG-site transpeptidase (sortase) family protein
MSRPDWDSWIARITALLLAVSALTIGYGLLMPDGTARTEGGFRAMGSPAAPVRLVVPSLRIKAPVVPIEVDDRAVLDPPRNPRDVGWWQRSARPGAKHGQTVLTGHTVHTGGGVMDELGRLRPGHRVRVVTAEGTMVYRATRVVTWTKDELARRAAGIFGQERRRNRLVLITCDDWTGSYYRSNIVVFARPLGVRLRNAGT